MTPAELNVPAIRAKLKQHGAAGVGRYVEALCDEITDLRTENDKLRTMLAISNAPCVYCSLPAADMAKCASGFPGCGRADDMLCAEVAS